MQLWYRWLSCHPRALAKWLGDLKPHLGLRARRGSCMEAAAPGCSARMRGVVLAAVVVLSVCVRASHGVTDSQDTSVLRALRDQWQNAPPTWGQSDDPCGDSPWEGVACSNNKVIFIKLSTMGIKGVLAADIGQLSELDTLDLSFNKDLSGVLTPAIGNLKQLTTLILAGCSFHGKIPDELGNLQSLSYMALNSNQFSGEIPVSLGKLSNLFWFDIADNQLSGPLPISTNGGTGLDKLIKTRHFHFNNNQLSGSIPDALFSPEMTLIHLLFDGNKFTGNIPDSLGFGTTLEVVLEQSVLRICSRRCKVFMTVLRTVIGLLEKQLLIHCVS